MWTIVLFFNIMIRERVFWMIKQRESTTTKTWSTEDNNVCQVFKSSQSYCRKYCPTSNFNGILNSSVFYLMGKRISLFLFSQFEIFHRDCVDNIFLLSSLECGSGPVLLSQVWPLYFEHYVFGSLNNDFNWYSLFCTKWEKVITTHEPI